MVIEGFCREYIYHNIQVLAQIYTTHTFTDICLRNLNIFK